MAKFSRAMKLNSPSDFSRVFRQGKRIRSKSLTIMTTANTAGHPRLGLAIAKKHVKRASDRNRLKRIIRESFREHQSRFANIDIVVLSGHGLADHENRQIRSALEKHWSTVVEQWQNSALS